MSLAFRQNLLYLKDVVESLVYIFELYKSNKQIEKSSFYEFLKPVFGLGLVTSPASKWRVRRKLMAPCFHPELLRGFLTVFNERSVELVNILQQETKRDFTNPMKYLANATLDIVCETMFGVSVNAQKNKDSKYVNSIERLQDIFMSRIYKPWQWFSCTFKLTEAYKEIVRNANIFLDFTTEVSAFRI
ncbi:probable cytochrome P450 4e1 [Nephila pilipes]|uniref:Probable cytochrome P450 4e1 n=1 Tax=Nephila pilipes TaxID=299642 RepID=A0A8X6MS32_NEPPI|nr:probable cytochrome P450 4e1 [Nephila pilipes]